MARMKVGVMLPYLDPTATSAELRQWCRSADAGPFSSIACGERVVFHNLDQMSMLAMAAGLTDRVKLMTIVAVTPMHATGMFAKRAATVDRISDGRLVLGVGIGGRPEDYQASELPREGRHQKLDDQVAEMRRLWSGEQYTPGMWPLGPMPVQKGGPKILAGAYGPKSLARAARWADGFCGGSAWSGGKLEMMGKGRHQLTIDNWMHAWNEAGREGKPYLVGQSWYTLADDGAATMMDFGSRYFSTVDGSQFVFSPEMAPVFNTDRMRGALDDFEAAGFDELILLPATARLQELDRLSAIVTSR